MNLVRWFQIFLFSCEKNAKVMTMCRCHDFCILLTAHSYSVTGFCASAENLTDVLCCIPNRAAMGFFVLNVIANVSTLMRAVFILLDNNLTLCEQFVSCILQILEPFAKSPINIPNVFFNTRCTIYLSEKGLSWESL